MTALEGPAILALITVFGIGMVCGALMLGAIVIATTVVIKLGRLGVPLPGVNPNDLVALEKTASAVKAQLEQFVAAVDAAKGGK